MEWYRGIVESHKNGGRDQDQQLEDEFVQWVSVLASSITYEQDGLSTVPMLS